MKSLKIFYQNKVVFFRETFIAFFLQQIFKVIDDFLEIFFLNHLSSEQKQLNWQVLNQSNLYFNLVLSLGFGFITGILPILKNNNLNYRQKKQFRQFLAGYGVVLELTIIIFSYLLHLNLENMLFLIIKCVRLILFLGFYLLISLLIMSKRKKLAVFLMSCYLGFEVLGSFLPGNLLINLEISRLVAILLVTLYIKLVKKRYFIQEENTKYSFSNGILVALSFGFTSLGFSLAHLVIYKYNLMLFKIISIVNRINSLLLVFSLAFSQSVSIMTFDKKKMIKQHLQRWFLILEMMLFMMILIVLIFQKLIFNAFSELDLTQFKIYFSFMLLNQIIMGGFYFCQGFFIGNKNAKKVFNLNLIRIWLGYFFFILLFKIVINATILGIILTIANLVPTIIYGFNLMNELKKIEGEKNERNY